MNGVPYCHEINEIGAGGDCRRADLNEWVYFESNSKDGSIQTITFDKPKMSYGLDGLVTSFVYITDTKGNVRMDTIMFAAKPIDWSQIDYSDLEQAEQIDIYF